MTPKRRQQQRDRRQIRIQLGLCYDCTEPAKQGTKRCEKHLSSCIEREQRVRARRRKLRGWRLVKVPV